MLSPEPDFTGVFDAERSERLRALVQPLYGDRTAWLLDRLEMQAVQFASHYPALASGVRSIPHDAVLIAYADQVSGPGGSPLAGLNDFAAAHLDGIIGHIHILPFFPWSSDAGFSIIDYREVAPHYGRWHDVERLGGQSKLMFDLVLNHASAESPWFANFKAGIPPYDRYFRVVQDDDDLSNVVRPRTTPLTHLVETVHGLEQVWTTFSADQIDLDYANPDVFVDIVDVLLGYVSRGARMIRLDAIAFIWKEPGTSCVHLPGTHALIQAMREILDAVAPEVLLVTETNVPHAENISYFGDGQGEAQMVYNFALPPLILDAIYRGDGCALTDWAETLSVPSDACAFFNITATHDGIGVRGVQDILSEQEVARLVEATRARGGLVSYRHTRDGMMSPYELNITFFDALLAPDDDPDDAVAIRRYLTAQSIAFSLQGVPALYFNNLIGARSDHDAIKGKDITQTEFKRLVNRQKFDLAELEAELADPESRAARVAAGYLRRIKAWRRDPAFAPAAPQQVLRLDDRVFALVRGDRVFCLHNLSGDAVALQLPTRIRLKNMIDGALVEGGSLQLPPWGMAWLAP